MSKKYRVANYRLREGTEYVPPAEDYGPLFSVSYRPNTVVLTLNGECIDFLSDETRRGLRRYCKCVDCGGSIHPSFEECPCQTALRSAKVASVEKLLQHHSEDRTALNSALKAFFGNRTSEKTARAFIADAVASRKRFGGPYEVNIRNRWKVFAWCGADEQYRAGYYRYLTRKKRLAVGGGKHTSQDADLLFNLQNGECYFCAKSLISATGRKTYSKDHLQPVSRGGSDSPVNIALVCNSCNPSKHMKTEDEFWAYLRRRKSLDSYYDVRSQARRVARERKRVFKTSQESNNVSSEATAN